MRWIILSGVFFLGGPAAAQDRYVAEFADGSRHAATELQEWHSPDSSPQLGGKSLFDPGNPVRWIIDRSQPADARPDMFVEFQTGDRLVGEVQGYRATSGSPYEQLPPHLLVLPQSDLHPPDDLQPGSIRVALDALRRVVWQRRGSDAWQPGHIFLRNGGRLAYRSLRWNVDGVAVLLEDGVRSLSWVELAEIHLPRRDPQQAYVEQLAVLGPTLSGRLMQLETGDGSILTTSNERFQARHWGDKNRPAAWLQLLQPAWSLDPLWVRVPNVITWRWFAAHEPPLTLFAPTGIERDVVFSAGWSWQRDRNTQQQRLQVADQLYGYGFGVHATTELTFELPPLTREFRTRCGLDAAAGVGGCVAASVMQRDGSTLFQQPAIIGSRELGDSGWQPVTAPENQPPQIALRMDMVRDNRPPGADPFDIRDIADWIEPTLRLDRDGLAAEVAKSAASMTPGLAGWTLIGGPLATRNHLDETDSRDLRYRTLIGLPQPFTHFHRAIPVTGPQRWVSFVLARFGDSSPKVSVQIKIDGISCGEFPVPVRHGPIDPDPITVPLPVGPARTVNVEVIAYPHDKTAFIEWRGVATTIERPGVRTLYEDDATAFLTGPPAGLAAVSDGVFSGDQALQLQAGRMTWPQLDDLQASIVDLPKLGQFRFLVFAWKSVAAPGLGLALAHDGRMGTELREGLATLRTTPRQRRMEDKGLRHGYAYDIGHHRPTEGSPLRLHNKAPADWRLETRDIINDFGPMTLTGFGLECLDAGAGLFDHIYLARTPQDVERLKTHLVPSLQPSKSDPVMVRQAIRPEDLGAAVAEFAPAFATPEAPHGLHLLVEHMGQAGAWRTHPIDQQRPFVLRTVTTLPADRPQELDLRVSHHPESDWLLTVLVNGEKRHEQVINDALTQPQRGWASIQVDLSRFRGQTVLLELRQEMANQWSSDYGYWKRIAIVDR